MSPKENSIVVSTSSKTTKMAKAMVEEAANRKLLTQYIAHHMKDGTDFGKIHIKKDCPNQYNCTNSYHFSKPSLFKPGAEKFASLLKLRAAWRKDTETWEMLGSLPGTICYICELFTSKDKMVGEGRGASSIEEKKVPNVAIKIAKKRAFVDAILATGALSDFFTQDLEDMGPIAQVYDHAPIPDNAEMIVSGVDDSEPEVPMDEMKQKQAIVHFVKMLEPKTDLKNKKAIELVVSEITQLSLVPKNYAAIIESLNSEINIRNANKITN